MKIRHFFALMLIILISAPLVSQDGNSETTAYLTVDATGGTETISRHIYDMYQVHHDATLLPQILGTEHSGAFGDRTSAGLNSGQGHGGRMQ
jgi:hypothetical protein